MWRARSSAECARSVPLIPQQLVQVRSRLSQNVGRSLDYDGKSKACSSTARAGAVWSGARFSVLRAIATTAARVHNFSAYGQDEAKLTKRVTLTFGLRWS